MSTREKKVSKRFLAIWQNRKLKRTKIGNYAGYEAFCYVCMIIQHFMLKAGAWVFNYLKYVQFDIHRSLMKEKIRRYNSFFRGKLLDIGAGDAPYLREFQHVSQYDATNSLKYYANNPPDRVKHITTFWTEDTGRLPGTDEDYDTVVCFQVLSVIDQPAVFFSEVCRILKPGGVFAVTTDFLYPKWNVNDRQRYTDNKLAELAVLSGFTVMATESFGGYAAMKYAVTARYLRSFPSMYKKKSLAGKYLSAPVYLLKLILMTFYSFYGYVIFLAERNRNDSFDYTFNNLIICRKPDITS